MKKESLIFEKRNEYVLRKCFPFWRSEEGCSSGLAMSGVVHRKDAKAGGFAKKVLGSKFLLFGESGSDHPASMVLFADNEPVEKENGSGYR